LLIAVPEINRHGAGDAKGQVEELFLLEKLLGVLSWRLQASWR
jgi:hypothetical protein